LREDSAAETDLLHSRPASGVRVRLVVSLQCTIEVLLDPAPRKGPPLSPG